MKKQSNKSGPSPTVPQPSPAKVIPMCSKCFCTVGPGKPHTCHKTARRENLSNIVRNTSRKSQSTVASNTLKNIAEDQSVSTRGGTLQLQTGSKQLPVKIGTPQVKPKEPTFSHENLKRLQAATNLSDKSLL